MGQEFKNEIAEKALLGILLSEPSLVGDVVELLSAEDFYEPRNELIFSTLVDLYQSGEKINPVSLLSYLKQKNLLKQSGDLPYIMELMNRTGIFSLGADPISSALLIKESSKLRSIYKAGDKILEVSKEGSGYSSSEALEAAESKILTLSAENQAMEKTLFSLRELYPQLLEGIEERSKLPEGANLSGIPTGFSDLDAKTNGFKPGQMIIIAARPGLGKSTLAVDFARAACFLAEKTVLFFSLEMGAEEIGNRILSAEARVETDKIMKGTLTPEEWLAVKDAKQKISKGNFILDVQPNTTIGRIKSICMKQLLKPEGLDMVIIDYLQLMETNKRISSREQQVSELSRQIKLLAKEMGIPIIVLSQLNRNPEQRQDSMPKISDLRESGSLEQDADIVLLINRPEATDPNVRPNEADLILAKNRGGSQGKIRLTSMLAFSKFVPGTGQIEPASFVPAPSSEPAEEPKFADTPQEEDEGLPW